MKKSAVEGKGALGEGRYDVKHVIVATGARRAYAGAGATAKAGWTDCDAMVPDKMPESLLVVGSGAIGIEFACSSVPWAPK